MADSAIIPASDIRSLRDLEAWRQAADLALDTQVELARRPAYLSSIQADALFESAGNVGRLLQGLWRALK